MNRVLLQIDHLIDSPPTSGLFCREDISIGLHHDNLFDQNEDAAGELFDQATGVQYDNSTYTGIEDLTEIEPAEGADLLPPIDEDDEAAAWLRSAEAMLASSGLKRYLAS